MSIIKNGQISQYFHFNEIIKEAGTSFQSPDWAKNMLEMFVIHHANISPNFILIVLGIQKN